jgi:hypothetical protein
MKLNRNSSAGTDAQQGSTADVTTSSQTIAIPNVVCSVVGTAFEEDHWQVVCPNCQKELEYKGYFDSSDITNCKCGTSFKTSKIEFENGSYIE